MLGEGGNFLSKLVDQVVAMLAKTSPVGDVCVISYIPTEYTGGLYITLECSPLISPSVTILQ